MKLERVAGAACGRPFPVYTDLAASLAIAHPPSAAARRDPLVAHLLGTLAGYAYADADTVATMASRMGLEENACILIAQSVDAMLVFSTAYIVQSRCGRVVVLCYRGTEPAALGNWLGDADVGAETMTLGGEPFAVHGGFRRNMRATRWAVLEELRRAAAGESLRCPGESLEHPMEALFVTGHSLGGAVAVLFALSLLDDEEARGLLDRLRAVYTFGQSLVVGEPLPAAAGRVTHKLFRHILARDPIPALPASPWGRLAHCGEEYRFADGEWERSETPVAQLESVTAIPRSLLAFFATAKRRDRALYTIAEHMPHQYIAALRPPSLVTEMGDWE